MGSGASLAKPAAECTTLQVILKQLPDAVEEAVFVNEKFPLVIDPTGQAGRFFKYQTGAFVDFADPTQCNKSALNRALVASFLNGRTMVIKIPSFKSIPETIFEKGMFPVEVIDRMAFFQENIWKPCLKPNLGDPTPEDASITSEFAFIIVTSSEEGIPAIVLDKMHVIKVVEKADQAADGGSAEVNSTGDPGMDQIAALFGASEIIRYEAYPF
jgi:hypothetical protein